jgi:hypothetical protein
MITKNHLTQVPLAEKIRNISYLSFLQFQLKL